MRKITDLLRSMTYEEKLAWFCSAKRVTVGRLVRVDDYSLVEEYYAKIHGVIVGHSFTDYRFGNYTDAMNYGKSVLAKWKKELARKEESNFVEVRK